MSETFFPVNHLAGTSKTKPNQIQLTTQKPKQPRKNYKTTHKLNQMKLKPGLGASYTIRPGKGVGLFYIPGPTQGVHFVVMRISYSRSFTTLS